MRILDYLCLSVVGFYSLKNLEVKRTIDLTKLYEKQTFHITVSNNQDTASSFYLFSIPLVNSTNLGFVKAKQKTNNTELNVLQDKVQKDKNLKTFKILFDKELKNGETLEFIITTSKLLFKKPKPYISDSNELQLFEYYNNLHYYSLYETDSENTVVKLPSSFIEKYTVNEPVKVKGSEIIYGPYKEIKPLSYQQLRVHYNDPQKQIHINKVFREVELSYWNNDMWIQENYEIQNLGPQKEQFNRVEHQYNQMSQSKNFFQDMTLKYKYKVHNAYYRDEIGNVSTSNFITNKNNAKLDIKFRYPLYGQWIYGFNVGYHRLLNKAETITNNIQHTLEIEYLNSFHNIPISQATLRIVLPEGAKLKKVIVPFEDYEKNQFIHYTYFDFYGRTAIDIKTQNLIGMQMLRPVKVVYEYTVMDRFIKLRTLFISFVAMFTFFSIASRITRAVIDSKLNQ